MIITFFRSSGLSEYLDMCEMKYFIIYVLGQPSPSSLKADMGSVTHLALEWLALLKMQYDEGKETLSLKTSAIDISCHREDLYIATRLTDEDINKINKTRINKQIFLPTAKLPYGQIRYGTIVVNKLITAAYEHFSKTVSPHHPWVKASYLNCYNWTWMALEQNNRHYDPRFRKIISPEQKFDLKIEEDWAKYSYFYQGQQIDGYLGLKGTIDLVTEVNEDTIEVIDWKGLPLDTPLPTPSGWTTMGDVKIDDILFDMDGNQTKVIGKSKVKNKPCYKITFDDTSTAICDDEHLWTLNNGNVVPVTKLKKRDKISLTKPINTENVDLPIDPYVLGYWLGNGRNRGGEICSSDQFIFDEITKRGYNLGEDIGDGENCESKTIFNLTKELRKLNLLHNKHIPSIYLRASYEQRLDLLRGLMDSDGNVNEVRKQAIFTSCTKELSNDTKELLLTLGQRPLQSYITRIVFDKEVEVYPISFRPVDINPFLLPRKADRIDINWGPGESNRRLIKNIELIDNQETQCISVDSPTSTYLCTENMIPTHNTGKMFNWGKNEAKTFETLQEDKQLMFYYYAIRKLFPNYKNVILTINFVRDGGAFSVPFDDSILPKIEGVIRDTFEDIKNKEMPKRLDPTYQDHRCKLFCPFFKRKVEGNNYCRHITDKIEDFGIDYVTETETREGHYVGYYENPGE